MGIFESLENLNVSEECLNDILNIVEEYINERNKENKIKKNNWENNLLGIDPQYKDKVQNKINNLRKDADDYYWAHVDAAGASPEEYKRAKELLDVSDKKEKQANRVQKNFSKKFINRQK